MDPRYLIPLFDRLCCCLPATWRKVLRCNRDLPEQEVRSPSLVRVSAFVRVCVLFLPISTYECVRLYNELFFAIPDLSWTIG